jgi:predicted dehydrogenase
MNNGSNQQPLSFALVGCGRISQVHLETLAREPHAKLSAVVDIDGKVAASAAEANDAQAFTDIQKMLEDAHPDAVIVCTPPNTHRKLSEIALSAGAHVLCEKPLAITVEDAEAMVHAAEKAGRALMMASKFRYVQDVVKAKGIIESGILGELILFENEFCSRVDMKSRWNSRYEVAGGGVLIDNGSHSVDIVRYLIGPIGSLQAIPGKRWQEIEVEDTSRLFLRCVDGTMAAIDLSWSIHKENPYYIHVYGTAGTLEVGWKRSRYRQSEKLDWVNFGNGYDKFQAVGAQLSNFINTILGKEQPVITAEDAVESVRVIQSAYRTAEQSRWEKVAP